MSGEHLIEGVVADVGDQGHRPHQQRADVAELRPRLDHLRQPELRSLRGVKGHEECAEGTAEHHRNGGPQQIATERDAEYTDGECRQMGIAGEPHRPQVPDLAVPFGEGHIVDRALFDEPAVDHRAPTAMPPVRLLYYYGDIIKANGWSGLRACLCDR